MNEEQRREGWIAEAHGDDAANWWAWEMTPMPIGLPSDEQLDEGLAMALAADPSSIRAEAQRRFDADFEEYKATMREVPRGE